MWCLALSLNTYTKYIIISDEFTFTLFTLWEKLYFFQDNNPEGGAKTLVWQSISISWPLKPIKNQLALDPTSTVSLKIWTIEHKDYKRAVSSPFNTPQLHVDGVTSCRYLNVKREKWNGVRGAVAVCHMVGGGDRKAACCRFNVLCCLRPFQFKKIILVYYNLCSDEIWEQESPFRLLRNQWWLGECYYCH